MDRNMIFWRKTKVKFDHGYLLQNTGEFSCKPGYLLVGNRLLKCGRGVWSSKSPFCAGIFLFGAQLDFHNFG